MSREKSKAKPEVSAKKNETPAAIIPAEKTENLGLHNLEIPFGAHQRKRILGRGPSSGHGKTSTRGSKGQTSRAGRHMYAGFEGGQTPLIRRMPKRGFTNKKFKKEYQIVNLTDIARLKDSLINPELLEQKGIIRTKFKAVKILGDGVLNAAKTIQAHAFSVSAQEKITKAGGKFEVIKVNV